MRREFQSMACVGTGALARPCGSQSRSFDAASSFARLPVRGPTCFLPNPTPSVSTTSSLAESSLPLPACAILPPHATELCSRIAGCHVWLAQSLAAFQSSPALSLDARARQQRQFSFRRWHVHQTLTCRARLASSPASLPQT